MANTKKRYSERQGIIIIIIKAQYVELPKKGMAKGKARHNNNKNKGMAEGKKRNIITILLLLKAWPKLQK